MDTLINEQSLKLQLALQRAIPCLLASNDFIGNLETSLRILGDALSLDYTFISIPEISSANQHTDDKDFCTPLALEKSSAGWQEFISQREHPVYFQYKPKVLSTLNKESKLFGAIADFMEGIDLNWRVKGEDRVYLIPLWSNEKRKGLLGLGVRTGSAVRLEDYQTCLTTYIEVLAGWLERCEVFRHVKRERDQLRDLLNLGESPKVEYEIPYPTGEHSINDAQLLNRKIVSTIPDQVFIIDLLDSSNLYSNKPNFLGYSLEEIDEPFQFFQQLIHPDDVDDAFEHFFEKLLLAQDDDIVESEYRMFTKKGELVWFNERVKVFKRDKEGNVWQYLNILQDVTERRHAELAKKESDILFRNLFEKNPLGIVIGDAQGNLLRCNSRFAEILGYEVEELNQKTFMNITHPDEIAQEWELVGQAIEKGMPLMFMEKRYIHREGHIIWANVNMSLLYHEDGSLRLAMAMIEDVTDKKRIRLKLENNEAFQKAILSTLPDLKFRISKDGIYLDHYPSPNDDPALQTSSEQFIGKTLGEVLPDYLAKAILANIKEGIETKKLQAFEYMLPIGANMYHFEIRLNAINDDEVVAVIRNVSERNWAQVELKNKIQELDEKNRELKDYIDSNMQLENFAYIASHDLREPLRTMGTFAQLLEKKYEDQLDDTAKTYIRFVVQGAKNMNNLIEDLLVYSRIQTEDNRQETIPLPFLLKEVVSGLRGSIEEQEAKIQFNNIPEAVSANPNRLKQLFQNLLANAIKFKKQEAPVEVEVKCRDLGAFWEFEIKDNGIGIDPEFHSRIFLLFKKLHSRKDFQGTGLGLAICKKVVEQMGGEIWVESAPGIGSSFFFTMPKKQFESNP